MDYIYGEYGRSAKDCCLLSIVAARDVEAAAIEAQAYYPRFRQVVVPAGDEADTPYWDRKPRQEYIDIAKQFIAEFNN